MPTDINRSKQCLHLGWRCDCVYHSSNRLNMLPCGWHIVIFKVSTITLYLARSGIFVDNSKTREICLVFHQRVWQTHIWSLVGFCVPKAVSMRCKYGVGIHAVHVKSAAAEIPALDQPFPSGGQMNRREPRITIILHSLPRPGVTLLNLVINLYSTV